MENLPKIGDMVEHVCRNCYNCVLAPMTHPGRCNLVATCERCDPKKKDRVLYGDKHE